MDLNKNVELVQLFDLYGSLLTKKQQEIFNLYVLNDLSLAEVSAISNISRQAVKDSLDKAVNSMQKLENNLQILSKFNSIKTELEKIEAQVKNPNLKKRIKKLVEEI